MHKITAVSVSQPQGKSTSLWLMMLAFLVAATTAVSSQAASLPDFTKLAEDYSPSVVKINATVEAQTRGRGQEQVPDFFRYFFEDSPYQYPQPGPSEASGSGFFISTDGYVLTNNHVIDGATAVTVRLTDRTEYEAEIIGTDPRTDIALLKVSGKGFPALKLADSDKLKVGEWVLAIGSPFNLDYSVTSGIVSAIGRNIGENYVPFIQTDVAINPGNSGGPLFNLKGEVVGINSQIYTRSGGYMGVSFAIPSNLVKNVMEQLQEDGRVARGWLGVVIQNVDQDLAESFGLSKPQGALVSQVLADSPAAKAGLKTGDIILEFNGRKIPSSSDLPPVVGRVRPGSAADVKILRNGDRMKLSVTIEELPSDDQLARRGTQTEPGANNILNVVVQDLTAREVRQLGERGVVVVEVMDGPAAEAGVQPGDVVTMIGSRPVTDSEEFARVLDNIPSGRALALRILRNGNPMFLPIRIE